MSLLASGRFLTILPAFALKFAMHPEIKVLPVRIPIDQVPTGVVTLKARTLSPVAQLFIDYACELAKALNKRK